MIILPIGIDGCGKESAGKELADKYGNLEVASLDIFSKDANEIIENKINSGKSIYFLGSNLEKKTRENVFSIAEKFNQKIEILIFCRSYRPDLCEENYQKTSNLLKNEKGESMIKAQFKKFKTIRISSLKKEISNFKIKFDIKFISGAWE